MRLKEWNRRLIWHISRRFLSFTVYVFLREYYSGKEISYPINPFQMLTDLKIAFLLRPFKKYEGIYIPAEDEEDFPIVGINLLTSNQTKEQCSWILYCILCLRNQGEPQGSVYDERGLLIL